MWRPATLLQPDFGETEPMCDTFVALPSATATGGVLLAKNADTEVNEAQHVLKLPRRRHPVGSQVRLTHLVIPQAEETHEVLLDKSFWLYGGEIGVNEYGLAIGNEAVFSTLASKGDGVILIDLLRLMLERCRTRHEAADLVADMLKTYGQGGNCEMRGNSHFDGSFIVADRTGAIVLETAGQEWSWREVKDFASISNGYTIHADWTRSSLDKGDGSRSDFGALVGDKDRTFACGAPERRAASEGYLARHVGRIGLRTMADLLRCTGEEEGYHPTHGDRPTRVCMHAAPYQSRLWQATGALISDTRGEDVMAWTTATSGPDVSIFKPAFFGVELPDLGPMPRETDTPGAYWWRHERLHRRAMADYSAVAPEIRNDFEALEDKFFAASETVRKGATADKATFVSECWRQADEAEARWLKRLETKSYAIAHDGYRTMWSRFNEAASLELA
jgi:secernin